MRDKTVNGVKGKDFLRRLEAVAESYAREITKSLLPFSGHKDLGIGVASIATRWLSGDAKIIPLLRKADKILEGGPACQEKFFEFLLNERSQSP